MTITPADIALFVAAGCVFLLVACVIVVMRVAGRGR